MGVDFDIAELFTRDCHSHGEFDFSASGKQSKQVEGGCSGQLCTEQDDCTAVEGSVGLKVAPYSKPQEQP